MGCGYGPGCNAMGLTKGAARKTHPDRITGRTRQSCSKPSLHPLTSGAAGLAHGQLYYYKIDCRGRTVVKQLFHFAVARHFSIELGLAATAITAASVALTICAQLP